MQVRHDSKTKPKSLSKACNYSQERLSSLSNLTIPYFSPSPKNHIPPNHPIVHPYRSIVVRQRSQHDVVQRKLRNAEVSIPVNAGTPRSPSFFLSFKPPHHYCIHYLPFSFRLALLGYLRLVTAYSFFVLRPQVNLASAPHR